MAYSLSEITKTCGICSGSLSTGQATFTSQCSHSFHFHCINTNLYQGTNNLCPVCHTKWNNLPSVTPFPNPNNFISKPLFNNNSLFSPFFRPQNHSFEPEPPFSDDEPLPDNPTSNTSPLAGLQKVTVKTVTERPAVASSESVSQFTVLVGLKAPSLSNDRRRAPIDLVAVLDVSGSMQGSKLALLKQAVHFMIDNLGPNDRLSIVSFCDQARRLLPLRRMTEDGRGDAKQAVNSVSACGGTNIVEGLKKGVRVLEERQHRNPVRSIMFLSDGNDTYNSLRSRGLQNLLPPSIFPKNRTWPQNGGDMETIPVHSFGFGSDHDPVTMHSISDASGGTFSFIQSHEMVQDAFAGCIGGLLSVVAQELRIKLRSASHGVEIKSISSGRYASEISNQSSQGQVTIGDLYADEDKQFLIDITVPMLVENNEGEGKTFLLDIMCSYKDIVSKEMVHIEGNLVEIRRPKTLSPSDKMVNLEVDRQRNRLIAAECIAKAQEMAERGDLTGARNLLEKTRADLLASPSGQAGDGLCMWLEADIRETERRMRTMQMYEQEGRAYALAGMSSHAFQRATTKGYMAAGAAPPGMAFGCAAAPAFGGCASPFSGASAPSLFGPTSASSSSFCFGASAAPSFSGYATPNMVDMVKKSQQHSNKDGATPMEE